MTTLLPIPQNFRLVNEEGFYTPEFKRYLDGLLARVGGIKGGTLYPLNPGPSVGWDLDVAPVAYLVLGENATLLSPTNAVAGNFVPYRLTVVQDATGGRTLTWGAAYKFAGGVPPVVASGANQVSEFWFSSDGTSMFLVASALNLS